MYSVPVAAAQTLICGGMRTDSATHLDAVAVGMYSAIAYPIMRGLVAVVGNEDKWINCDKRTGKLVIRFRVKGFPNQFFISSRLPDTKRNREIVRLKRDAIANDIALGAFDPTLEKYQFRASAISPTALAASASKEKYQYNLQELWEKFTEFQSTQLEQSTIQGTYRQVANVITKSPTKKLEDAADIRNWLLSQWAYYTAWRNLSSYNQCCKWAVDSNLIPDNPFESLRIPRPKKRSHENQVKAYTLEQRDIIIAAFESHPRFAIYTSFIKFLFWTGCRPGEALALTWGDISSDCTRISISKAIASRIHALKGTKNNKRRVFPCSQGSKLQNLLLQIKPQSPNSNDPIFKSKSGHKLNSRIAEKFWLGHSVKGYFYPGVVTELADKGVVPYLSMYSTRHTFATWAIASGASPEKVAYWLGDDVPTVLEYYCHPDVTKAECPDF